MMAIEFPVISGVKMGYVRVSTKEQNTERQERKMRELGIEERFLFIEHQSGKDFNRPQYQSMRNIIRKGDLLYVDSLDRLGRNYDGIIEEWHYITRKLEADIIVLDNEKMFNSLTFKSMGDLGKVQEDMFLVMLAYVADVERKKNRERQAEGIAVALDNGVKFGRQKIEITPEFSAAYSEWKAGNMTAADTMRKLGMRPNTFYRRVKEYEGNEVIR